MDIATIWNTALSAGDWVIEGRGLKAGSDLESAVLISLFTDRRASEDDIAALGLADPGGWWGDTGEEAAIGSRLWLRRRAKATPQTLKDVQNDAIEALQWLIDDRVVARIEVAAEWLRLGWIGLAIVLHRTGARAVALNYEWAWQGVN